MRNSSAQICVRISRRALFAALASALLFVAAFSKAQTKPAGQTTRQEFLKMLSLPQKKERITPRYDPAYVRIPYPGGDVPEDPGVCTDEVIRSYRAVRIDLQKEVHEDMEKNFSAYPRQRRWLARRPDTNIDHLRVPNLMAFFSRKGASLTITEDPADYSPGWNSRG